MADLGTAYVELIDTKARGNFPVRVIFDNYTKVMPLKESTRERRRCKLSLVSYVVDDATAIRDKSTLLSSNSTKDSLTLYLAKQLIVNSTLKILTATRKSSEKTYDDNVTTGVSTQEEADTLLKFHALDVVEHGGRAFLYTGHLCTSTSSSQNFSTWTIPCNHHGYC